MRALPFIRSAVLLVCVAWSGVLVARWLPQDDASTRLAKARDLLASGKAAEAATLLDGFPGDPAKDEPVREARATRVRALLTAKEWERAIESGLDALRVLPESSPWRGRIDGDVARALEGKGDIAAALEREAVAAEASLSEASKGRIADVWIAWGERFAAPRPGTSGVRPPSPVNRSLKLRCLDRAVGILDGTPRAIDVRLTKAAYAIESHLASAKEWPVDLDAARKAVDALLAAKEESPRLARGRLLLGKTLRLSGNPIDARAVLSAARSMPEAVRAEVDADLALEFGEAWVATNEAAALDRGLDIWSSEVARTRDAARAALLRRRMAEVVVTRASVKDPHPRELPLLVDVAEAPGAPAADVAWARYRIVFALKVLRRWDEARAAGREFLARFPADARVPEVQREVSRLLIAKGDAAYEAKKSAEAVAAYREFLDEYPLDASAPGLSIRIVKVLVEDGAHAAARDAAKTARDRWMKDGRETAAEAGVLVGELNERHLSDLDGAVAAFRFVVEQLAETRAAGKARAHLARLEAIDLGLDVARTFAPGEPVRVVLRTRNVKAATFRVYKLDAKSYFDRKGTLGGTNAIDVALVKADASFTFSVKDFVRYRADASEVVVPDASEGAWVVTAEAEQRRAAATIFVTRARIVTKQYPGGIFAWVTDATTGNPAEGVEVLARNGDFKTSAVTASDGTVRLAIPAEKAPCEVIALVGKSVTPGFAQPIPAASAAGLVPRLHWVLDRPVVRPNDVLRFAAFLREPIDGVAVSVEGRKGVLSWIDPRGRVFDAREVATGPYGRFDGEVAVPESGVPGTWKLQATFGASVFTQDVSVRVFTTPEFRVAVSPAATIVAPGDEISATVRVGAWSGGAVAGARVDWVATAAPADFDGSKWREASWWYRATRPSPPPAPGATFIAEGSGTCDESGSLSISFRTENVGLPRRYIVQAYVRDSASGFISGSGSVVASFTPGHVVVIPDRRVYRAGDRMTARLVGVDWTSAPLVLSGELEVVRRGEAGQGAPVSVRATVALGENGEAEASLVLPAPGPMLVRYTGTDAKGRKVVGEWPIEVTGERPDLAKEVRFLFEREAYGAGTTARAWVDAPAAGMKALLTFEGEGVLEHRIVDVTARNFSIDHPLTERLAPNVVATLALWHDHALLTAQDPLVVLRQLDVSVTASAVETRPGADVTLDVLVRDQAGRPVEAAVALSMSDAALEALAGTTTTDPRFTFNRDVRPHRTSTGSSAMWKQAVEAVALDRDVVSRAKLESERLALAESGRELADRGGEAEFKERGLAPSELRAEGGPGGDADELAKDAKPGSEEKRMLRAPASAAPGAPTGGGGGGVAGRLGGARMGRRDTQAGKSKGNGDVRKADDAVNGDIPTITAGLFKDAESNAADKWASGSVPMFGFALGTAGEAETLPEPVERTRFADVAAWHPTLVSGADGRVRVTVKLPDNLTTWTAAAAAVDRGVSAGSGSATVRAMQPVSIRMPMPPAFAHTDAWRVAASVRNAGAQDLALALEARSADPSVARLDGVTRVDLSVKAGSASETPFDVKALKPGVASFSLKVSGGSAGDAVTVTRPIRAFGEPWDGGNRAAVTDGTTFDVEIPTLVDGSLSAAVVVQADLATDLLEGITLLAEARGGGLETTANRVVASLALHRALAAAGRPSFVAIDRIEASARALVREIRARAGDDGIVRDGTEDRLAVPTALCAETLARLRDFGIEVPEDLVRLLTVGADALLARGGAGTSADERAWLVLGLAMLGQPRPNVLNTLVREGDALAPVSLGRAVVAAALMKRDASAASFLGMLRARRRAGDGMPFPKAAPAWFNAEQEATAWAILAYRRAGGREDEVGTLVSALRRSLALRGCVHTRAAAASVIALAEVAAAAPAFDGDVAVMVDGVAVGAPVRLSASKPWTSVALPVDRLTAGKHRIDVRKSGAGEATVRLRLLGVKPADSVAPTGNLLTVTRQLLPYREPDRASADTLDGWDSVIPAKRPAQRDADSLKESWVGAKLTVRTVVEAREDIREIVLEDPFPAGCEPVESGLRAPFGTPVRRESGWMFRIPAIQKGGRVVITYPVICGLAGTFSAMPAEARAFYDPEVRGASASMSLKVFEDPKLMTREPARVPPPDVRIDAGRKAFAERRWADAVLALRGLTKDVVLRDELADEVLAMLQVAHAMLKQGAAAVAARDELLARNPRAASVCGPAALAIGRAYAEAGDADRARELFRQVREETVDLESAQAVELAEMASERLDVIAIAEAASAALLRWPTEGKVPALELEAAGRWLSIEDPATDGKALPPERRVLFGRALDAYARVAAWNAGGVIAERASLRRLDVLRGLGALERFHVEASAFAERHPESEALDAVLADDATALFGLKRFDEASARATKVLSTLWPIRVEPGVIRGKSPQHARMAGLLGKIAHVAGRLDDAVARYAEAKDSEPDANVAHAFLTRRTLSTPGIVTVAPKSPAIVAVTAKNVERVSVMIYPVDLGVLFAVRKSFDALNRADLSGIAPATSAEHALGMRKYVGGTVDVKLPELGEGAYLAVVTDGERSTTTLVVVTALAIRIDRVDGNAYAYLTDGEGRPVEGARVSLGMDGRVVYCGDTDQRGSVGLGVIPDRVTVVAEKGAGVAVTRE